MVARFCVSVSADMVIAFFTKPSPMPSMKNSSGRAKQIPTNRNGIFSDPPAWRAETNQANAIPNTAADR